MHVLLAAHVNELLHNNFIFLNFIYFMFKNLCIINFAGGICIGIIGQPNRQGRRKIFEARVLREKRTHGPDAQKNFKIKHVRSLKILLLLTYVSNFTDT